jgi:hypothetical protein
MCARLGRSLAAIATLAALTGAGPPGRVSAASQVLLIGDSVATGMQWHPDAVTILQRGLAVEWQVAVCRRLTAPSCPFQGDTPPDLVDLVSQLGSVPPIVVVEMGYNDFENTFSASVEQSLETLLAHGAQHILWLTLREVRHPYVRMNRVLAAAATLQPALRLVDWNLYSRNHPEWFQDDGEHLLDGGGVAMATLIHLAVDEVVSPLEIVAAPGPAHIGIPYSAQLVASGGAPPYRWQLLGPPPRGLHLLAGGRLYGTPTRVRTTTVALRVTDTEGQVASSRLVLSLGP